MTNSLWVTLYNLWKAISSHLFYDWQSVSDIEHFVEGSLTFFQSPGTVCEWHWTFWEKHLFLLWTGSGWPCTFCERQSHQIFPMTNSLWVTLHILWKAVSSDLFLWPTACEQHSMHILWKAISSDLFLWPQQRVSDIAQPVKNSLITSFPMTNSKWVNILWNAVSSDFFLWPIASEWHCTFCERQTHQIFSYVWPTVCEWDWTFCERLQSHHIFSYDQQEVNNIAHFVNSSLITSFPMINRELVTVFHILWKVVSSDLFLWPTDCGWIQDFVKGSLIRSFPITNSLWVPLHTLWRAVSSYLFLWPTVCEWQCTLWNSERDPNNDLFLWPPACEWHCTFYERQSHHIWSTGSE